MKKLSLVRSEIELNELLFNRLKIDNLPNVEFSIGHKIFKVDKMNSQHNPRNRKISNIKSNYL